MIKKANALLTTNSNTITYLVVIVSVKGVKCGTLIDTGAGSSNVSSKFISLVIKNQFEETIQTLRNTSSKRYQFILYKY